jgi:putative transposase
MRTAYKVKDNEHPYFITSTIVDWIPVFNNKNNIDALINAFKHAQKEKQFIILGYVIMPEHFHMVCICDKLIKTIQSIKSYTAKRIIETYVSEKNYEILNRFKKTKKEYKTVSHYQVWQEGFMPKAIISDKMFGQKINYLHYNPVKRGLVKRIEEYEFSSARDYMLRKPGRIIINDLNYL